MSHAYILQDKTGYDVAVAIDEEEAVQRCKEYGWTYRMVPLYMAVGTEIKAIAGPIPKEYLTGW